ncbi:hypothetical protein CCZ20_26395 [Priestia aryabhattai]|uniref:hypothetical protein n=1 Tax=Priestia aryabhattai TaxID=412384 RepID=UPI000B508516|nr:hypothetical protein [Priestia aryabhattai]OVE34476.1 hypothetical protein CCZ20_26395 [Priestia aryabhattai]
MKKTLALAFSLMTLLAFPLSSFAATYSNQTVTAYVAPSGKKTYHGTTPRQYNTAAVHPKVCGSPTSGTKLPKGTIITTSTRLGMPNGTTKNTFVVEDMGDVKCDKGHTSYWFDIFFGVNTSANYQNALTFGKKKVSYSTN